MSETRPLKPYRGPAEFRYIDHVIFKAREQETFELGRMIVIYRGVLVYGESGVGKSSLINAGLIPELETRGLQVERLRLQNGANTDFRLDPVVRGEDTVGGAPPSVISGAAGSDLALTIAELDTALKQTPSARLVLIFDQFEEIITQFDAENVAQRERRDAIVSFLLRLFHGETALKLVLVFREDYLARIHNLLAGAPQWLAQTYWLHSPEKPKAYDIIHGPFASGRFADKFGEALIRDVAAELARSPVEGLSLSDLQIACLELWESDHAEQRWRERGLNGLVSDYLQRELQGAGEGVRHSAAVLLGAMVTPQGTRNNISAPDAIEKARSKGINVQEAASALEFLVGTRLVRVHKLRDVNYYDIVSESIIPWIRETELRSIDQRLAAESARALSLARLELEHSVRMRQERLRWIGLAAALVMMAIVGFSILEVRMRTQSRMLEEAQAQVRTLKGEAEQAQRDIALLAARRGSKQNNNPEKGFTMFGSNALEVVIGLGFLLLLLALVCAVATEMVAALRQSRARLLRDGIQRLLFGDIQLCGDIYRHPLIESLSMGQPPSYIASRTFSVVLVDMISAGSMSVEGFRSGLIERWSGPIRGALLPLAGQCRSLDALLVQIESWFDSAMDTVSGVYKRRSQVITLLIAALLAVGLNVDALRIVDRLAGGTSLRASLVAAAYMSDTQNRQRVPLEEQLKQVEFGLPIGWARVSNPWEVPAHIPGWIITILAVSIGAPFWFDTLNRFMVVRATVKPGEKSRERSKNKEV